MYLVNKMIKCGKYSLELWISTELVPENKFYKAKMKIFLNFLVNFGKVLCSPADELQQNSNASSREEYIPQILTVLS